MTTTKSETSALKRHVPILGWLPGYQKSWFSKDMVAGLTVWALVVPESMAYAGVAGLPVQFGLYSIPLAALGYVVFGTSKQLFVGPSSTVAALSFAVVAPYATSGSDEFIALSAALALLVGVCYIVAGLFRMGFVAKFFAKPVLDGFIGQLRERRISRTAPHHMILQRNNAGPSMRQCHISWGWAAPTPALLEQMRPSQPVFEKDMNG